MLTIFKITSQIIMLIKRHITKHFGIFKNIFNIIMAKETVKQLRGVGYYAGKFANAKYHVYS